MTNPPSTVRDLMAPLPSCMDQLDTVVAAARRMRASGLVSVPVTGDTGQFLGMLSDRDIIERCIAAGLDPATTPVVAIVQSVQSITFPDRVLDAAVLLQIARHPHAELPVVEDGRLVGMLSIADVIPLLDSDIDGDFDRDIDSDFDRVELDERVTDEQTG